MNSIIERVRNSEKWKIFNKIYSYTGIVFLLTLIVVGLIKFPIETLKILGFYVAFFGSIIIAAGIHEWLIGKEKINWSENIELKKTSGWLCFSCFFFIYLIIYKLIDGEYDHIFLEYSIFLIFSIWTYLSVVLVKNNAILLLRSFLIFSILAFCYIITVKFLDWKYLENEINGSLFENLINIVVLVCFILLLPSLIIKGIIISFSNDCKEILKNQKYRYRDILLITLIVGGIIFCYNNDFNLIKSVDDKQYIEHTENIKNDSIGIYNGNKIITFND